MVRLPRAGTQASYPSKQALTELLVERIVQGVQKDGLLGHVVRAVTVPALSHRHGQCDLGLIPWLSMVADLPSSSCCAHLKNIEYPAACRAWKASFFHCSWHGPTNQPM